MSNPDSTSSNSDANRTDGASESGLDATSNFAFRDSIEATGVFDSSTRVDSADVTAAFDSTGRAASTPISAGIDRARGSSSGSLIGSVIGGYRIVAHLGQGGMGRVFRADDSSGRPVAIKLLSQDLARSSEALARFKQEGLIASQINHSRCVFVHRVDEDAGTPFIAMELMTGLTLKDLVNQKGPLPYQEALKLILQCIEGLIEAHSRGMIHRDIKPANCYLDSSGNVKIGDFGLARSLVGDSELTQTGAFIGTPLFASPEQLLGQEIDVRSDIYSLTSTLYFLLAGKAPFESPHAAQVIARIASSDPPPFSTVDVQVPEELERIVMKGLSREASKRYESFVEMQVDLLHLLAPKPESASLVRRVVAGLADALIISLLKAMLAIIALPTWAFSGSTFISTAHTAVVVFLYFCLSESIFRTSLGKAALRIRVADAETGRPASIRKTVARAVAYSGLTMLLPLVSFTVLSLTGWSASGIIQATAGFSNVVLTYLLILSSWKYTKKRQLLHDWISGTECLVSIPPIVQVTQLDLPDFTPKAVLGTSFHSQLGRFQVKSEITAPGSDGSVRWLSAEDPQLDRAVWIAVSTDTQIDYEQLQCTKDPSTRLRFIEQGDTNDCERWFAYVAPEGIPIQECLTRGVHFAWPVTNQVFRQMIAHFQSVASGGSHATIAKPSDWWVDRAGRVSIVSLSTPRDSGSASYQQHDQQNLANYKQLLQTVCLLALPRSHKLRKPFCSQKSDLNGSCLLAREALPPLRSIKFCETVAAGIYTPVLKVLEQEISRLNKGNHCVNSKARFLNSVLSLAFSIPLLLIVAILTVTPGIFFAIDRRDELQLLTTFTEVVNSPQPQQTWWDGASDEQRDYWTSDIGKERLAQLKSNANAQLENSFSALGKIEQLFIDRVAYQGAFRTPPAFDLGGSTQRTSSESLKDIRTKVRTESIGFVKVDLPKWSQEELERTMTLTDGHSVSRTGIVEDKSRFMMTSLCLVAGLAIWTWVTFGGMSTRVTGICFVARDGSRMGFLRSGLRALIVFLPILILLLVLGFWPLHSSSDLWWATQFKRGLLVLPAFYLVSTVFWNNRTLADLLAGTTAIPR